MERKERFYNEDGTYEDLSFAETEKRVEDRSKKELGFSFDEILELEDTDRKSDLLYTYFNIVNEIKNGRRNEKIYVDNENTYVSRATLEVSYKGCFSKDNYSLERIEAIEGSNAGTVYEARITNSEFRIKRVE